MTPCPFCGVEIAPQDRRLIAIHAQGWEPDIEAPVCQACAKKLRRKLTGETHSVNNKALHRAHMEDQRKEILQIIQARPGINSLEISRQTSMSYEAVRLRTKDLERDGIIKGVWKQGRGRTWIYRN